MFIIKKISTMILVFFILTKAIQAQTKNKVAGQKPNIIFILADDLGYGDLSCYGQKKFTTPNIDKLSKEGIRFTQAYAGTAVCAPSRSALFTGLHTGHTPIRGNLAVKPEGQYPMPDSVSIIPQLLKKGGYATGCFGKWGLGYPSSEGDPVNKGFDEFFGYNCQALAHNYYPYHLWHNKEKILLPENDGAKMGTYAPALIHKKALQFIDDNKNRPFALFITTTIPHAEVAAPEEYMKQTLGKYEPEYPFVGTSITDENYTKSGPYTSQANPHAGYVAMIKLLDDQVGEIVKKIQQYHLDKNTIIIFSSDNGPSIEGGEDPVYFNSSGGLRGHKRDLYEGGIREPMIVKWPGRIKPGSVTNQMVAFWDVLPTFNEIANIKTNLNLDGISFLPTLTGKGVQQQHKYFYWEFYEQGGSMAVRMNKWKAVRRNLVKDINGPIELYDLEKDPAEKNDIADQNPEIIDQMKMILITEHVPSPVFQFSSAKVKE